MSGLPLHIFEPRYRQLVADCVLDDRPFVIVLERDGHVEQVGCAVRFARLLRRSEDGQMDVLCAGVEPVEILAEEGDHLYFSARVRSLVDDDEPLDTLLAEAARAAYRELAAQVTGSPADPAPPEASVPLSYEIAGGVAFDPASSQALLEERSENERLRLVIELLAEARESVSRQKVAAERAHTNGKVHH